MMMSIKNKMMGIKGPSFRKYILNIPTARFRKLKSFYNIVSIKRRLKKAILMRFAVGPPRRVIFIHAMAAAL